MRLLRALFGILLRQLLALAQAISAFALKKANERVAIAVAIVICEEIVRDNVVGPLFRLLSLMLSPVVPPMASTMVVLGAIIVLIRSRLK
jgi:hypothetical protein